MVFYVRSYQAWPVLSVSLNKIVFWFPDIALFVSFIRNDLLDSGDNDIVRASEFHWDVILRVSLFFSGRLYKV